MAEPGNSNGPGGPRPAPNGYIKDLAERIVLGGVGALALTADRVDALVDALVARGGMQRDDARSVVDDLTGRWRAEAKRVGRAGTSAHGLFRELGLVTKADVEELELRIAQLEHRLRLVEAAPRRD